MLTNVGYKEINSLTVLVNTHRDKRGLMGDGARSDRSSIRNFNRNRLSKLRYWNVEFIDQGFVYEALSCPRVYHSG